MPRHLLEIYEPYDYPGPNPVRVVGERVLRGPNGDDYYLVVGDHDRLLYLLCPKYAGDPIKRTQTSCCTVNISLVSQGIELDPTRLHYGEFHHWGVGKVTPQA